MISHLLFKIGLKTGPWLQDKFPFIFLSSSSLAPAELVLDHSTCIISQDCVKILDVTIDKQLNFNEHISLCCTKAARQLNAFARIAKYLNLNSSRAIHYSFIASNFSYCPLVWHFCDKTNNAKLEKILSYVSYVYDYTSSYEELLRNTGLSTLLLNSLRPRQNGRLFADDTFKRIFLNENIRISIKISVKFVPKGLIKNIPALVLIMAWRQPGDKPLSEPMMVRSPTHICVTRLKCLLLKTFKTIRHINAECLHGIFKTHVVPYDLRTKNQIQPKGKSTTYRWIEIVLISGN